MKDDGFTIIEILTVIAIVIILISLGVPAYQSWQNRSRIAGAKSVIAQIEMALEMYKTENGTYPNVSVGLNGGSIMTYLGGYLRLRQEDLDSTRTIINDPWGTAYIVYVDDDGNPNTVQAQDFRHNHASCYIYSFGPDKQSGNQSLSADDIDNYDMQSGGY